MNTMSSLDRWKGKVAVVTGASAGIGASIVVALANAGIRVVGVARRIDRIEALKKSVKGSGELHAFQADASKEEDIDAVFKFVKTKFGTIHILINNAGIVRLGKISDQDPQLIKSTVNLNLLGLTFCTQQALKLMKESKVDDGHIIHINSVCGHHVVNPGNGEFSSIYSATKFGVTALTEQLRQELAFEKSKIRVTSISPGFVNTEIVEAAQIAIGNVIDEKIKELVKTWPQLQPEDISDSVIYVLSTPPRVQVHELVIRPVGELF